MVMSVFTQLETAVLEAIFNETPDLAPALEAQLEAAIVTKRENTGHGFFTTIEVSSEVPRANIPRVLGQRTYAYVGGLIHGLSFVLFMEDDRIHMLEGYSLAGEDTGSLLLYEVTFAISDHPQPRANRDE